MHNNPAGRCWHCFRFCCVIWQGEQNRKRRKEGQIPNTQLGVYVCRWYSFYGRALASKSPNGFSTHAQDTRHNVTRKLTINNRASGSERGVERRYYETKYTETVYCSDPVYRLILNNEFAPDYVSQCPALIVLRTLHEPAAKTRTMLYYTYKNNQL